MPSFPHLLLVLLALLLRVSPLLAQPADAYVGLTLPEALLTDAHTVVRYQQLEYTVLSDSEALIRMQRIVTLLSDNSDANTLAVPFGEDAVITAFSGALYDAFGRKLRDTVPVVMAARGASPAAMLYPQAGFQQLSLSHNIYPYTVAYSYERRVRNQAFLQLPEWQIQDWGQSCQYSRFTVKLPVGDTLYYHGVNLAVRPQHSADEQGQTWTWEIDNLPAVADEEYGPAPATVLPRLHLGLARFRVDSLAGSMRDWQAYGAFVGKLFAGRDQLPDSVRTEIADLLTEATSDREKIHLLYRYLQAHTSYVEVPPSIGGWQPHAASFVRTNGFGDAKALTNYMQALLKDVGIVSFPVLLCRGDVADVTAASFASPAFNHLLLYIPREDLWLDCSNSLHPPGYLGADLTNRYGLLLGQQGGLLIRTPAPGPADNQISRHTRISLAADGSAAVQVSTRLSGVLQEGLRYLSHHYAPDAQREYLHRLEYIPATQLDGYQLTVNPAQPQLSLCFAYQDEQYAQLADARMPVLVNKYFAYSDIPDEMDDRRLPIAFTEAARWVDTVQFLLPAGYSVEQLADTSTVITSAVGRYEASFTRQGEEVIWIRRLELRPAHLPASDFADFWTFFLDVARADRRQFVLKDART